MRETTGDSVRVRLVIAPAVHLIYIDESGHPEPADQPIYVLTAVLVDDARWHEFDAALRTVIDQARYLVIADVYRTIGEDPKIAAKWSRKVLEGRELDYAKARWPERQEFNEALRRHFDQRFELHAEPLWNRRDMYLGSRLETCKRILELTFDTLDKLKPQIVTVALTKKKYLARGGTVENIGGATFSLLVERLDALLQTMPVQTHGMLIADSGGPDAGHVARLLRMFQRRGTLLLNKRIANVIDNLHFVESSASPPVQVADIVGYFIRRSEKGCTKSVEWQRRTKAIVTRHFTLP